MNTKKYQILVVTLRKRDKAVMGVMEKIHSRQVSITVKNFLQLTNLLKVQLQSMNKLVSG